MSIPTSPVSRILIDAVIEANPIPPYPTFDGAKLDLERLESDWPSEQKKHEANAIWLLFSAKVETAMKTRNDALFKVLMLRGTPVDVPPVEEWLDLVDIGLDVSSLSDSTVKLLYIDYLIPNASDKLEHLVEIMAKSGLPTGYTDAVRQLFQEALAVARE